MSNVSQFEWLAFLNQLGNESGRIFGSDVFNFVNEVKTSRYIHGTTEMRTMCKQWFSWLRKIPECNEKASTELRNKGNTYFRSSETIPEATDFYTKAIYKAPSMSQGLALAHGNRAAAAYKLEEYQAAYDDCECALQFHHPKRNLILLRQATCAKALENAEKLEACLSKLEKINLNSGDQTILDDYRKELAAVKELTSKKETRLSDCVEKKQKIMRSAECGRFVIADETIQSDEIIMWEDPIAFVPVYDFHKLEPVDYNSAVLLFSCYHCAANDVIPFPCYSCRNVVYCSTKCRDQDESIHSIECNGYKVNLYIKIGIAHLALRSLLVIFDQLLEEVTKSSTETASGKCKTSEELWPRILATARDGELMGVCTNLENWNNKKKDIVQYALTASMLCCYLRDHSEFFVRTKRARVALMKSEFEWEIVISALLLRLISQMICNAHTIEGLVAHQRYTGKKFMLGRASICVSNRKRFSAIYPRVSLYNHACEPTFRNQFVGTRLYTIARKDIQSGEEIFNCYGHDFRRESRHDRLKALQEQYGFRCKCHCCMDESDSTYLNYHSVICKLCRKRFNPPDNELCPCPQCGAPLDDRAFTNIVCQVQLSDSVQKYKLLYDLQLKMERCFPKHTQFYHAAITMILVDFLQCDDERVKQDERVNVRMFKLAVDTAHMIEHTLGVKSLQFVNTAVWILDLMAYRKRYNYRGIPISFEVSKIKESFEMIDGRLRKKLDDYYEFCTGK